MHHSYPSLLYVKPDVQSNRSYLPVQSIPATEAVTSQTTRKKTPQQEIVRKINTQALGYNKQALNGYKTSFGQVSLEPLKPFRAIVEVIVKRKTGGGRWRYEVKVEATDAPPDDHISLRAAVGEVSSAVFRLCNRYLGYAPFQVLNGESDGKRRSEQKTHIVEGGRRQGDIV